MKRFILSIIFLVIIIGGGNLIIHYIYKTDKTSEIEKPEIINNVDTINNDSIINILKL